MIPLQWSNSRRERSMMGRLNHDQEQFFYSFRLDDAVPGDHPVRRLAAVLDLGWVYSELEPCYPRIGRPSVDPVLMIRMLIVGYAFAHPLGTGAVPGRSGEPGLSVVLWNFD